MPNPFGRSALGDASVSVRREMRSPLPRCHGRMVPDLTEVTKTSRPNRMSPPPQPHLGRGAVLRYLPARGRQVDSVPLTIACVAVALGVPFHLDLLRNHTRSSSRIDSLSPAGPAFRCLGPVRPTAQIRSVSTNCDVTQLRKKTQFQAGCILLALTSRAFQQTVRSIRSHKRQLALAAA